MRLLAAGTLALSVVMAGCATAPEPAPTSAAYPPVLPLDPLPDDVVATETLPSGLRVLWVRPSVGFTAGLFVPSSARLDAPGMEGLGAWMAHAAVLGARGDPDSLRRPRQRALELGGALVAVHDGAVLGWTVSGPASRATGLMALLADVVRAPTFPSTRIVSAAEVAREAALVEGHTVLNDAIGVAVGAALGQRRALPLAPSATALERLNREDVQRRWEALIRAPDAVLVIADTPDPRRVGAFSDWTGEPGVHAAPACPAAPDVQRYVAATRDAAAVIAAMPAPGIGDPLRPALEAALAARRYREVMPGASDGLVVRLVDRGDAAALLLIGAGAPDDATARHYHGVAGLRTLLAEDSIERQAQRALRSELLARREAPTARLVDAARRALYVRVPFPTVIDRAALDAVRRLFEDEDRWVRVGVGPDSVRRELERWGPVSVVDDSEAECEDGAESPD